MSSKSKYGLLALSALLVAVIAVVTSADTAWVEGAHRAPNPAINQLKNITRTISTSQAPEGHRLTSVDGGCVPAWEIVNSPQLSSSTILQGVDTVASNDVWAVGYYVPDGQGQAQTQIIHWDGTKWAVVASPNVASSINSLAGVVAVSADDVWAVGYYASGNGAHALILHWDGVAWSIVPGPSLGSGSSYLSGVTATAANDVWAVGDYGYPASQTLVLHWDGIAWAVVSSPNPGPYSILYGVTALSPTDAWAVGFYAIGYTAYTLTLHWDGSSWSIVPSPNTGGPQNILWGVAAASANDVWAVGQGQVPYTLIMHWNGIQWENYPNTIRGRLYSVAAIASDDVWAVGDISAALIVHWDGESWSTAYSPNPSYLDETLRAVQAVAANDIWAVGASDVTSHSFHTLTEHYTGQCVTPTPTPTITATGTRTPTSTSPPSSTSTGTGTRTATAPTQAASPTNTTVSTNTPTDPTLTATPCTISFSDVDTGHTFYQFIRCLACRGIISGYDDATFRPFSDITRGQIAKIVSNAAGFDEDPGPQLYEDVPEGSPFYDWINRLSNREHIGGYPCGLLPEEPCIEPDNLPYFRSSSSATRGQLAKIVSNVSGLGGTPSGLFYTDVPEDHTFYLWIMRLTELEVMSGYDCGGEGEPCDEENRPYFRPYNNVTRGQASKIVANTFFPGCQTPARP